MNLSYFIDTCEETDMFDGKIIHINQKARNIDEVHEIVVNNLNKYPTAHWELHTNSISI